jgi:hypothetical protein
VLNLLESNKWSNTEIESFPLSKSYCSIAFCKRKGYFILQKKSNIYKLSIDSSKFEDKDEKKNLLTLTRQMKELLQKNDFYDVKFKVEEKEIPAYKGILISRCPYFANLFKSGMKEAQDQIIDVPNVKYDVYYKLIEYIYCEKIDISSEIAIDLLKLAHEYSLPSLTQKCAKLLAKKVTRVNFLEFAELAEFYQEKYLQKSLISVFIHSKQSFLKTISVKDLPRFLLEHSVQNLS